MDKNQPTVALLNDTSLYNSHFGCQLVCQTFREQFKRIGLTLKISLPGHLNLNQISPLLESVDLVVVNGEGTIHHGKGQDLIRVAGRFPSVLVNCVYQENPRLPELNDFRLVATRESLSAQALRYQGVNPIIVPDVIFVSSFLNSFVPSTDPQKKIGVTDNVTDPKAGFKPHGPLVAEYLNKLYSYRKLCIGRFHAAIAAICLRIPFSTWDSNTWKTRGMMADMGLSHLHAISKRKALKCIPEILDPATEIYANNARIKIIKMFDEIGQIAHKLANK